MKIQQIARKEKDLQQPVNEDSLKAAISSNLPNETLTEVQELDAGFFNNTYLLKTLSGIWYILKISPKHQDRVFYNERFLMQREQSLVSILEKVSNLIPPYINFFEIDGREAFIQLFIEGKLWQDNIDTLSDDENERLWLQLGEFTNNIHTQKGESFGYPEPFKRFSKWSEFIIDNVDGMLSDCHKLGLASKETRQYRELLDSFIDRLNTVSVPYLLHGDIWPRNILFQGAGKDIHITAVIDAERAFWGDPLCDWVLVLYDLPEAFWQGYGENLIKTGDPALIAIYRGMYFVLNLLETLRFDESKHEVLKRLAKINSELKTFL